MWTPMVQADTSSVAEAIAGAGRSVGQGLAGIADRLERRKEEQKREQTNAKSADTLFKANPDLQKALGMDEHAFMGLPRAERIAAVAGGISHLTLQQANAKAQREQELYAREAASAEALQRAAGASARGNMENYFENPELFPNGLPAFDQAILNNPAAVNAPNFNQFARAAAPNGGSAEGQPFFQPTQAGRALPLIGPNGLPLPGMFQVPVGPRASQIITDPTQPQRPAAEKPSDEGTIEVPDEADPVYGPRIRLPLKVARDKYPHLLKRLEAPATPAAPDAPAAAASGPPTVTTRAQFDALSKGAEYIGKDGRRYRKP